MYLSVSMSIVASREEHWPVTEDYPAVRLAYCDKCNKTEFPTTFSAYSSCEELFCTELNLPVDVTFNTCLNGYKKKPAAVLPDYEKFVNLQFCKIFQIKIACWKFNLRN